MWQTYALVMGGWFCGAAPWVLPKAWLWYEVTGWSPSPQLKGPLPRQAAGHTHPISRLWWLIWVLIFLRFISQPEHYSREHFNPIVYYHQHFGRGNYTSPFQLGYVVSQEHRDKKKPTKKPLIPCFPLPKKPPAKNPQNPKPSVHFCYCMYDSLCLLPTSTKVLENILLPTAWELKGNCFI